MVYAEAAVECVGWIRGDSNSNTTDLPSREASIAAALTAIIHNARFIEDATHSCGNLGNISMLVCVRAWRPINSSYLSPTVRNFRLWGPSLTTGHDPDPQRSNACVSSDAALHTNSAQNTAPNNIPSNTPSAQQIVHLPVSGDRRKGPVTPTIPGPPNLRAGDRENLLSEVYAIPKQVSLQCLSL